MFTPIWRPAWPHFGVLQKRPKIAKPVNLYTYPGRRSMIIQKILAHQCLFNLWYKKAVYLTMNIGEDCTQNLKKGGSFVQVKFKKIVCQRIHWFSECVFFRRFCLFHSLYGTNIFRMKLEKWEGITFSILPPSTIYCKTKIIELRYFQQTRCSRGCCINSFVTH